MLYLDIETYCDLDLPKVGVYRYAEEAIITLVAYAFDDELVKIWEPETEAMPDDLREALDDPSVEIVAHNAQFERILFKEVLGITLRPSRFHCTMAIARSHGFPASLKELGKYLNIAHEKLAEGARYIRIFTKPDRQGNRILASINPEAWGKFIEYAIRDVEACRDIWHKLPKDNWKIADRNAYNLDQYMNDCGMCIDIDFVDKMLVLIDEENKRLLQVFNEKTDNLGSPARRKAFLDYIEEKFDIVLPNTSKVVLDSYIKTGSNEQLKQVLLSATKLSKSSVAKYKTLLNHTSKDGVFRGGLKFRGASRTRRWAGNAFQPQNLPSRGLPPYEEIEAFIGNVKEGNPVEGDILAMASAALRSCIIPRDGDNLYVADLANIEGRINAYLARENWKIQAFRDYDKGIGEDLYILTASSILGKPTSEVSKAERNVFGKIPELALGYGGGDGAFTAVCDSYGINFVDYEETIRANTPIEILQKAESNYDKFGFKSQTEKREWMAREAIKLGWRAKNSNICNLWYDCESAAVNAFKYKGHAFNVNGYLNFISEGLVLKVYMPSGACLYYDKVRIEVEDSSGKETLSYYSSTGGRGDVTITTGGIRAKTYGGKLVENVCQSLAYDILVDRLKVIAARARPILTVHDEIVVEPKEGYSFEEFLADFSETPSWLPEFPLACAGEIVSRYRKI